MKKLGIVGGVGWPSTLEYYRLICEASELHHKNQDAPGPTPIPEMVIESLNMNFTVNNRGTSEPGSWDVWDSYFNEAMKRLEASGAKLILVASVTPHTRLKEIVRGVSVPVLSMYDAVGAYCSNANVESLLVLGTLPTMTSLAFQTNMGPFNVNVIFPPAEELKAAVVEIIGRLYKNETYNTREDIERVVRASIPQVELERSVVFLGCTELPLAFSESKDRASFTVNGITYLNSAVVHAAYAFQESIGNIANNRFHATSRAGS